MLLEYLAAVKGVSSVSIASRAVCHPLLCDQIYSLSAKLWIMPSGVGSYSFSTTSSPSNTVFACTKTLRGFAWRTTGDVEAECSFGPEGVWDGFSTKGDDGSLVSYERT